MQDDPYNFNGMDDSLVEICKEPMEKEKKEKKFWKST